MFLCFLAGTTIVSFFLVLWPEPELSLAVFLRFLIGATIVASLVSRFLAGTTLVAWLVSLFLVGKTIVTSLPSV